MTLFLSMTAGRAELYQGGDSLCKPLIKCREHLAKYDCADFATNAETAAKIRTCSTAELQKPRIKSTEDLVAACGSGVSEEAKGIWKGIKNIPSSVERGIKFVEDNKDKARAFCLKFLSLKEPPDDEVDTKNKSDWNSCVTRKIREGYNVPGLPSVSKVKQALEEVFQSSQCFKAESVVKIVCPVVASVLVGGVEGYALKRAMVYFAERAAISGSVAAVEVEKTAEQLKKTASSAKEALSVGHQMDLIVATESYGGKKVFANLGMNLRETQMGIMASDAGKMLEVWNQKILGPGSDEVIKVLSGQSQSQASKAMKEIFAQNGMKGKSLLNGDLSPAELRAIFEKNPRLMTGYLHELPGLADAITAVNANEITVAQFQARVSASLFHNGPNAGFWKFMGDELVPQMLGDSGDATTKNFFKNTVFEGATNSKGVIVPNYPSPISKEGVFHTVVDRLSQASRGGLTKIYMEMGNPSGKKGLDTLNELLTKTQKGTLEQLQTLDAQIGKMAKLSAKEREGLSGVTKDAAARLQEQQKFYNIKYENGKMEIKYGRGQIIQLNETASSEDIYQALHKLMAAEERAHGEPLSTFIKTSYGTAIARPASLGLADLPLVCSGDGGSSPRPPPEPEGAPSVRTQQ